MDIDFGFYLQCDDIEFIWFVIKSLIFEAMYLFIPKISLKHNHGPKWFDSSIRHHLKCLRTLRRKQKANPSVQRQRNIEISEKELKYKMESSKLKLIMRGYYLNHYSQIIHHLFMLTCGVSLVIILFPK